MRRGLAVGAIVLVSCTQEPDKLELCRRAAIPVCEIYANAQGYDSHTDAGPDCSGLCPKDYDEWDFRAEKAGPPGLKPTPSRTWLRRSYAEAHAKGASDACIACWENKVTIKERSPRVRVRNEETYKKCTAVMPLKCLSGCVELD